MKLKLLPVIVMALFLTGPSWADDDHALHFTHPLVTESPLPDTKLRLDYIWQRVPGHHEEDGEADLSTVQATAEYAFSRSLGMEVSIPYTWRDPDHAGEDDTDHLDNIGMALKYADMRFVHNGIVIGAGIEAGLATGDDESHIGSDNEFEVAPFVDFPYRQGDIQVFGFAEFGFPLNTDHADFELDWNLALVWAGAPHINFAAEIYGDNLYGGEEGGHRAVYAAPGVIYEVPGYDNVMIGAATSFPVTEDKDFYIRPMVSLFYHF